MCRTTFNVAFYCRESKCGKNGLAPIEVSITINGERSFLSLPMKVKPSEFNVKRQPKHIKDYLDAWRVKFIQIQTEMLDNDIPLTTENLKKYVRTGGVETYTLSVLSKEYLNVLKHRCDCPVYRKYEMVYERLVRELDNKEVKQINNGDVQRFYQNLCKDYKPQTSAGMFQKVRSLFKFAVANGKIRTNVCEGIRVSKGKTVIDYLTEEELDTLSKLTLHNEALERTRDIFLFMCGTGLAYVDVARLEKDDVKQTEDGSYYIQKRRQKTGTQFTAVMLDEAVQIWNKYHGNLPVLSNQKTNSNLKMIEDILQFPKHLHCHLARHTYCTVLINKGVRVDVIADAVGHSSTMITRQYYAFLKSSTVIDEITNAFK